MRLGYFISGESQASFSFGQMIVMVMFNESIFVLGNIMYGKRVHVHVGQPNDELYWTFAMNVVDP